MKLTFDESNLSELDREYTLSLWGKRYPTSKEALAAHLNFIKSNTTKAKEIFKNETLSYDCGTMEVLDIYGTDLPNG